VPTKQAAESDAPVAVDAEPATQEAQAEAPELGWYVPAPQIVQLDPAALAWYCPAPQLVHAADEPPENWPTGQLVQAVDAEAPVALDRRPATHPAHDEDPVAV
jgi:hypothetical protein